MDGNETRARVEGLLAQALRLNATATRACAWAVVREVGMGGEDAEALADKWAKSGVDDAGIH